MINPQKTYTSLDIEGVVQDVHAKIQSLQEEIAKVIVGQEPLIKKLLIGLFTQGHVLVEGVPGLAKTLTVSTLAKTLDLDFKRIQFTPDLLPSDLIGTLIYNQQASDFLVKKGPVFANIILADEINRSPAKVQSALLEAMQERQVTIGSESLPLDLPFLVMATQNPIDEEGTYPLPEAQVDRFMMKVYVSYPQKEEEKEIMRRMAKTQAKQEVDNIMGVEDIARVSTLIDQIRMADKIEDYIVDLVMATRSPGDYKLDEIQHFIEFGASPRASLALNLGARAQAIMDGRDHVLPEDVKAIASDVLNHRIILNYEAEAEDIGALEIVNEIIAKIPF